MSAGHDARGGRGQPGGAPLVAPRAVDASMVLWMILLTAIWGFNAVTVRMVVQGMAPIMSLVLRGALALGPLTIYGWLRGESFRFRGWPAVHLTINGVIMAVEFIGIYLGARFTTGGRLAIFLNTAPFFTALGAHFLLLGERLHWRKVAGLLLAFAGVLLLFGESLWVSGQGFWRGDLLVIIGAVSWAISTLYIKRFLLGYSGFQLLYLQVLVSTPILLVASLIFEPDPFPHVTAVTVVILLFQSMVVVNFSYLMFLVMLRTYPASALHAFSFLTPVFGVLMGAAMLGEGLTAYLLGGMVLIGLGLNLVNRPDPRRGLHPAPRKAQDPP